MTRPLSLRTIVQEVASRTGRPITKNTPRFVSEVLAQEPGIIRCGEEVYGPARVVLDGKAFRVTISDGVIYHMDIDRAALKKTRLEPFYQALNYPPLQTEEGDPLRTLFWSDVSTPEDDRSLAGRLRATLHEQSRLSQRLVARLSDEDILSMHDLDRFDMGVIDLTPLDLDKLPVSESGYIGDLIVRWDQQGGALVVSLRLPGSDDPASMEAEDRILADFFVSRLPMAYAVPLSSLYLEAYAQCPELGQTPGSELSRVVWSDTRMRLIRDEESLFEEWAIAHPDGPAYTKRTRRHDEVVARSGAWERQQYEAIMEHPERLRQARAKEAGRLGLREDGTVLSSERRGVVRLLFKPTHEELIAEWDAELEKQGISDTLHRRKINHLLLFASYLQSQSHEPEVPGHLLDVDEGALESFFFWTYIRRFPNSKSDAKSFPLDLRDFYRYQEAQGRITDARFAELVYRLRRFIVERLELYENLGELGGEYDDLCEQLFLD
jgi:hypothetical protein